MTTKLRAIKVISRAALGLVWLYEGFVPKILFLRADEIDLVRASHLVWRTPEFTLQILGVAQMLVGLWLIIGFAERAAVFIATLWMLILIGLVASGNPAMLTDPYGALVKDFCLVACAITVWTLASTPNGHPRKRKISTSQAQRRVLVSGQAQSGGGLNRSAWVGHAKCLRTAVALSRKRIPGSARGRAVASAAWHTFAR